jgi:hypothetical protein
VRVYLSRLNMRMQGNAPPVFPREVFYLAILYFTYPDTASR